MLRLAVWKWTLGYVADHPLGGGFDVYLTDVVVLPPDEENPGGLTQSGRAFHSIYFEVLGELGVPGIIMFLLTATSSLISLLLLSRKCRKIPDLIWAAEMSDAVQTGMLVFLTSGAFVGIAFQPPFWYFVSMTVCLRAYVWRHQRVPGAILGGWRSSGQNAAKPGVAAE